MQNLIGLILPIAIDFVNRWIPNTKVRYIVSVVICFVVSVVVNFKAVQLGDAESFFTSFGLIFAEAQTVYKLYWEKSQVRERLKLTL